MTEQIRVTTDELLQIKKSLKLNVDYNNHLLSKHNTPQRERKLRAEVKFIMDMLNGIKV